MKTITIGVILPKSSLYPLIGADFIAGIKAGFNYFGNQGVKIINENAGFGGDEKTVYAIAEKMLIQEDADIVIAFLDHQVAVKIEPLFHSLKRFLLVVDPGAHIPLEWGDNSGFRFTLSLYTALACRLTGRIAAENGAKQNIFATSFYEGGYLQTYAFNRGLEKGGGGIYYHDIIPFRLETYDVSAVKEVYAHQKPDAILAQFSIEAGSIFFENYRKEGLLENLKVYVSPFMLEEQWLSGITYPGPGMKGVVSWSKNLSNHENQTFITETEAFSGRNANIFTMIGWEAAQIAHLLIQLIQTGDRTNALSYMEQLVINSPRGTLTIDKATNFFYCQMYLAEIITTKDDKSGIGIIEKIPISQEEWKEHIYDIPPGIYSRWTNTYLCI